MKKLAALLTILIVFSGCKTIEELDYHPNNKIASILPSMTLSADWENLKSIEDYAEKTVHKSVEHDNEVSDILITNYEVHQYKSNDVRIYDILRTYSQSMKPVMKKSPNQKRGCCV